MVAQTTMPLRDPATGTAIDPQFDAGDPTSAPSEGTRPSDAAERQMRALAPAPDRLLLTIGGGIAAALAGGAVGFWLGRRSAPRPARPVRRLAARFDSAIDLAPVAMQLLGNPLIRTLAIRLLMRQLGRRIDL